MGLEVLRVQKQLNHVQRLREAEEDVAEIERAIEVQACSEALG